MEGVIGGGSSKGAGGTQHIVAIHSDVAGLVTATTEPVQRAGPATVAGLVTDGTESRLASVPDMAMEAGNPSHARHIFVTVILTTRFQLYRPGKPSNSEHERE